MDAQCWPTTRRNFPTTWQHSVSLKCFLNCTEGECEEENASKKVIRGRGPCHRSGWFLRTRKKLRKCYLFANGKLKQSYTNYSSTDLLLRSESESLPTNMVFRSRNEENMWFFSGVELETEVLIYYIKQLPTINEFNGKSNFFYVITPNVPTTDIYINE